MLYETGIFLNPSNSMDSRSCFCHLFLQVDGRYRYDDGVDDEEACCPIAVAIGGPERNTWNLGIGTY